MIMEKIRIIVVMKRTNENNHHSNCFHNKKNNNNNKEVLIKIAVIMLACRKSSMQKKETLTCTGKWSGKYTWKNFLFTAISIIQESEEISTARKKIKQWDI